MSESTAPKNEVPAERKSVQVSTTITPELFDALEDHRWYVRKKMTEVVKTAVTEYAEKNGLTKTADK